MPTRYARPKMRSWIFSWTFGRCSEESRWSPTRLVVKRRARKPTFFLISACSTRGGEGLPPDFLQALRRAVAHYRDHQPGALTRTGRELAYGSTNRTSGWSSRSLPFSRVLQRRLAQLNGNLPWADEAFRTLLDRMISITRSCFRRQRSRPRTSLSLLRSAIVRGGAQASVCRHGGATGLLSLPIRTRWTCSRKCVL